MWMHGTVPLVRAPASCNIRQLCALQPLAWALHRHVSPHFYFALECTTGTGTALGSTEANTEYVSV